MINSKQNRMRKVGYFAILATFVTAAAIYYWREDHGYEPGFLNELQSAHAYVENISQESSVFLFPDGQPTTEVIGTDEFSNHAVKYLMDSRPGRYRRAWGSGNIMVIQVKNFFLSGVDERRSIIANTSLPDFIQKDIVSSPHASGGCSAKLLQQFGWAVAGYILVDSHYHPSGSASERNCLLAGFDALDGLPLSNNSFELSSLPSAPVRRVVIDYVKACSREGISDAEPRIRSRYGISSLPSMKCVSDALLRDIDILQSQTAN